MAEKGGNEGMKQRESLHIEYQKHTEYPPSAKAVLTRRLDQRFGIERGTALCEKGKRPCEGFVAEMPYTGGSKNPMCHSLYDSIACFACWEAMPEGQRESVEEFTQTVALVFNGEMIKNATRSFLLQTTGHC